jgi:hypothetical protein
MNIHTNLTFSKKNYGRAVEVILTKYDDGSRSWRRMGTIATTTSVTLTAYALLELFVIFPVNQSPTPSHSASPCSPPPCLFSCLKHTRNEAKTGVGVICKYPQPLIIERGAGGAL